MKKILAVAVLSGVLGLVPALAQEKKEMPMKQGMPMNHEGMQGGGMMSGDMKKMHDKMTQIKRGMKNTDTTGMGQMMGNMSAMMGDMGHMMEAGNMSQTDMENMSQMMGDMSGMMKQMSDRMKTGVKKPN